MNGDEEAGFAEFVRRLARFAFRVAYAVVLNAADAEDVVQETFLKLHRHGGWQKVENEQAFMARVAWRTAVDHRRAARAGGVREESGDSGRLEVASISPDPEEEVAMADQQAWIHGMIDALPEDLRVPLVLSAMQEMTSREIAGVLGIPEGTVRTRLQRARQLLRSKLEARLIRKTETRDA